MSAVGKNPKKPNKSFVCTMCNKSAPDELTWERHISSQGHQRKAKAQAAKAEEEKRPVVPPPKPLPAPNQPSTTLDQRFQRLSQQGELAQLVGQFVRKQEKAAVVGGKQDSARREQQRQKEELVEAENLHRDLEQKIPIKSTALDLFSQVEARVRASYGTYIKETMQELNKVANHFQSLVHRFDVMDRAIRHARTAIALRDNLQQLQVECLVRHFVDGLSSIPAAIRAARELVSECPALALYILASPLQRGQFISSYRQQMSLTTTVDPWIAEMQPPTRRASCPDISNWSGAIADRPQGLKLDHKKPQGPSAWSATATRQSPSTTGAGRSRGSTHIEQKERSPCVTRPSVSKSCQSHAFSCNLPLVPSNIMSAATKVAVDWYKEATAEGEYEDPEVDFYDNDDLYYSSLDADGIDEDNYDYDDM